MLLALPPRAIHGDSKGASGKWQWCVSQFSDESVNTDFSAAGMIGIPVIAVLVFSKQTVIGTHIAFQIGVVRPGGMNHDAFDGDGSTRFIAGIFVRISLCRFIVVTSSVVKLFQNFLQLFRDGQTEVCRVLQNADTLVGEVEENDCGT